MITLPDYINIERDMQRAIERWENEGGRPRQNDEANYVAGRTPAGGGQTSHE